jgi:hypothetical protein
LLVAISPLLGCRGEDYRRAYDVGYQTGQVRGAGDGKKQGIKDAEAAAQSGGRIGFYAAEVCVGVLLGSLIGGFAQFCSCISLKQKNCFEPGVIELGLVPGLKGSKPYRKLKSYYLEQVEARRKLSEIEHEQNLKLATMRKNYTVLETQLKLSSELEQVAHLRMLDIANGQVSKIITNARKQAMPYQKEIQSKDWPPFLIDETITEFWGLMKRVRSEIMREVNSEEFSGGQTT